MAVDTAFYRFVRAKENYNHIYVPIGDLDTDPQFHCVHVSASVPNAVLHADRVGCNIRVLDHLQSTRGKKPLINSIANTELRQLSNLPFGPDCTKYLRMQLKPDPTGHAHVLDDPTEHTQVLDSNTAVIIIIALPLGILVSLAAFLAFIGVKREILSRENWSFSFEKGIAR